jgi:hypothetical protein
MELSTIAEAAPGRSLVSFAPYVPSVDAEGRVAFSARRADGTTAVLVGDGSAPARALDVASAYRDHDVVSHPAIAAGGTCWYAKRGEHEVLLVHDGAITDAVLDNRHPGLTSLGPLGPTADPLDERGTGTFAFRGTAQHRPIVGTWRDGIVTLFDDKTLPRHFGLPLVVNESVIVRADDVRGRSVVLEMRGQEQQVLLSTGRALASLGAFVSADEARVAIGVRRTDGHEALFEIVRKSGLVRPLIEAGADFSSLRGVIVAGAYTVFYATPHDGELALYLLDREPRRIVGLGDRLRGGAKSVAARDTHASMSRTDLSGPRVSDLALNPVSIHRTGWLAIRLAFEDGLERIVRAKLGA